MISLKYRIYFEIVYIIKIKHFLYLIICNFRILYINILFCKKFLLQKILIFQNLFILNILILKELVEIRQIILANHRISQSILGTWLEGKSTLISEIILFIDINWWIGMELISDWAFSFFSFIVAWKIIEVFLCWAELGTFNGVPYLARSSSLYDYAWQFCKFIMI